MEKIKSIGFPKMNKEGGEKRDFLPYLFEKLVQYKDVEICLEENYGEGMGFSKTDYLKKNPNIKFLSHDEIFKKDMIVVLRAPNNEELKLMNSGSVLFSMLHYITWELRNKLLKELGLICFSMDSLEDDSKVRMLVNYRGTTRAAVKVAFNELKKQMPDFYSKSRRPLYATILGIGAAGQNTAKAFEDISDEEFFYNNKKVPGMIIRMLPRSITKDKEALIPIIKETDILVDASKRYNSSEIIIPNSLIAFLPEYAVILDVSADSYNDKVSPIQVKGIEGIPTGTLDKYLIKPDDKIYDTIPLQVSSEHRRTVASCNAWPGLEPKECMKIYSNQILPFIRTLLDNDYKLFNIDSDSVYERALARASLEYYLKQTN